MDSETFRALARSSPWLWRSIRLTRTSVGRDGGEQVRAWIRRPGRMRVEQAGHPPYVVDDSGNVGAGRAVLTAVSVASDDDAMPALYPAQPESFAPQGSRAQQPEFFTPQDPRAPRPERRPDGLVLRRPSDFAIEYDDPMHVNYQWVAMLDPVELADGIGRGDEFDDAPDDEATPAGVEILEFTERDHLGRPAVEALVRPAPAYNPRCSCCPLLFSAASVALDLAEGAPLPEPMPTLAETFRVVLDLGTGVCVQLRDIGGDHDGSGFDVEIEEIDADYPDAMFR